MVMGEVFQRLCLALLPALETLSFVASLAVCRPRVACFALPPSLLTALLTASDASANPVMSEINGNGIIKLNSRYNTTCLFGQHTPYGN